MYTVRNAEVISTVKDEEGEAGKRKISVVLYVAHVVSYGMAFFNY
jgi:hypothetical protein